MRPTPAPSPRLPRVRAALVTTGAVAGARFLHGLATEPWARVDVLDLHTWLATTPSEDVVAALLRVAAFVLCAWVALSLGLAVTVRVLGWRPAVRLADRVTPAIVRRMADRVTGATLVLATMLGPTTTPAWADPDWGPPALTPVQTPSPDEAPPPDTLSTHGPATSAPATSVVAPPGTSGRTVVVRRGDHLWRIARDEVARRQRTPPGQLSSGEVASYWRAVVTANRARLRSGDPDVVFPGEVVVLP